MKTIFKKLASLGVSGVLSIICLSISWAAYKILLIENSIGELWLINPRLLVLMFYSYATALLSYIFYRIALELFDSVPPKSGGPSPDGNFCQCIKPTYDVIGENGDKAIVCQTCRKPIKGVFYGNKGAE